MERNKGITLIALIITIIVMLILIAVSVQLLIDSDLIGTAEKTADLYQAQADEEANLSANAIEAGEDTVSDYLNRAMEAYSLCDHEYVENEETVEFATTTGTIEVIWLKTNNSVIENPLEPSLGEGMTAVAWDGTTEYTPSSNSDWYNYVGAEGSDANTSSLWANAKTEDGSYWVWIPRFAYRITYYNSSGEVSGYSDGRGMVSVGGLKCEKCGAEEEYTVQSELEEGIDTITYGGLSYIVHPAFIDDSGTGYANGGWDSNLRGIWVAKFEMSMEKSGTATTTGSTSVGNVTTTDTIKAVSKPNVTSWRYISIGNSYTNAYNYNRDLESHLMKNSEWGAVAYLTHSQYGRNGTEVTINDSSSYKTGDGAYTTNVAQSSTGNIYGIYDLNGGAHEGVAVWNTVSTSSYMSNGSSFASTGSTSTKYATSYLNSTTSYTYYAIDIYDMGIAGDATKEVWEGTSGDSASWNDDYSRFLLSDQPFLNRGGSYALGTSSRYFRK